MRNEFLWNEERVFFNLYKMERGTRNEVLKGTINKFIFFLVPRSSFFVLRSSFLISFYIWIVHLKSWKYNIIIYTRSCKIDIAISYKVFLISATIGNKRRNLMLNKILYYRSLPSVTCILPLKLNLKNLAFLMNVLTEKGLVLCCDE